MKDAVKLAGNGKQGREKAADNLMKSDKMRQVINSETFYFNLMRSSTLSSFENTLFLNIDDYVNKKENIIH